MKETISVTNNMLCTNERITKIINMIKRKKRNRKWQDARDENLLMHL
jgi:hypothetical protein